MTINIGPWEVFGTVAFLIVFGLFAGFQAGEAFALHKWVRKDDKWPEGQERRFNSCLLFAIQSGIGLLVVLIGTFPWSIASEALVKIGRELAAPLLFIGVVVVFLLNVGRRIDRSDDEKILDDVFDGKKP